MSTKLIDDKRENESDFVSPYGGGLACHGRPSNELQDPVSFAVVASSDRIKVRDATAVQHEISFSVIVIPPFTRQPGP